MTDPNQLINRFDRMIRERDAALLAGVRKQVEHLARTPRDDPTSSAVQAIFTNDGTQPYGSAARTNPDWERAYAAQNWDEATRKIRTPAADMESVEWIRAISLNDQAMLREIADRPHNQAFQRADLAIGVGGAGTGGGLAPVGFAAAVELIISESARLRQLCNIVTGGEFALKIPQQTTKTVAAVHAEAADMATGVTEPVYGSITPEPKKLGALVKFSRELLDDSPLALLNLVTRDIGDAIGTLEDLSILDGTNFTDSLFADLTASADTWVDASETFLTITSKYFELASQFRRNGTWLINEDAAEVITNLGIGTDGRPTMQEFNAEPVAQDRFGSLLGNRLVVFPVGSSGVPANEAVFADLSGYSVYIRENLRAESSRESDFQTDQVALRVSRREDGIISQTARMLRFPAV
ncbi:MAG: phage major capsid protein [Myxococcales bacterium]|nr:phage major capsid protein [Myxococcales bacterium]